MRLLPFFLAAVTFAGLTGHSAAQEPIHVAVNLVNVGFTVRDARGVLVDNLTSEDVEVFEDAIPQKVAFFARSRDVPLTLGLIVDASGSQDHFSKHQRDLEVFLKEVLGPKDRAFLICFGNHLRLVSDFTQSGQAMLEAMREFQKGRRHFPEIGPKEERELGTAFYDSIYYAVADKLAHQEGRRALLIFSDGEDNSSSHDMMTAIETAQGSNVARRVCHFPFSTCHGLFLLVCNVGSWKLCGYPRRKHRIR